LIGHSEHLGYQVMEYLLQVNIMATPKKMAIEILPPLRDLDSIFLKTEGLI